jgi:histone H3/H4
MTTDDTAWKRCSTCKKPIAFGAGYYACSVSTCNRRGALFAFCSVDCWDGHVPVMRHREAWANEATAPTAAEWAREQEREREPRRIVVGSTSHTRDAARPAAQRGSAAPRDVLIVVSKLKHYVRETSGMNTSDDVIEALSDRVRHLCDDAVTQARAAGRKTVMARDFTRG